MEDKVREFIYLNSKNYFSLKSMKAFYWITFIIPFFMMVIGIASIVLFTIISIVIYSIAYWFFVGVISSRHVKKTFELRFLTNGFMGVAISSLLIMFFISFGIISNIIKLDFVLCFFLFYVIFIFIYVALIILGIHKMIFKKIKEKSKTKSAVMLSIIGAILIPISGMVGISISRLLRTTTSENVRDIIGIIAFVLAIFLSSLSYINFVQYFYCKKYKIICDEHGEATSSLLEPQKKAL